MNTTHAVHDDDMPAEIDFSTGTRGKFFRAAARLNLPVYLGPAADYSGRIGQRQGHRPFISGQ